MIHSISNSNHKQTASDDKFTTLLANTTHNEAEEVTGSVSVIPHLGDTEFPFKGEIHTIGSQEYFLSYRKNYAYNTKYQDEMFPDYFVYPDMSFLKVLLQLFPLEKAKVFM